jgi:spore maturation protein CgeB
MKIIYFATYYTPYLDFFYKKNPDLANQSYAIQLEALKNDYFSSYASHVTYADKLGAEAYLIIGNCKPLQKQWAKENNVVFDEKTWTHTIPLAQTKAINPDVFYIGSMFEYYGEFLGEIKKIVKKVYGWISCPIPEGVKPTQLDLILSSSPHYVEAFRKEGFNSELLSAAFDADIITKNHLDFEPTIPISFVGGLSVAHQQRIEGIKKMVAKTPIELYGYGIQELPDTRNRFVKKLFTNPIQERFRGEAWGLEMYKILRNSKITFNVHGEIANGNGVNMRMYEATGVGTLLLTDGKYGKVKMFEDNEVVYYENIDDAIEKAKYYLSHESERQKIAAAGQKRTLKDYNFVNNVKEMLGYFEKYY